MKLKSLTKNLHFFTNSRSHLETSLCRENFFPTAHSVCCHAMHKICWWDCTLHMFLNWKFFSATLERKLLFFFRHFTFFRLHMHSVIKQISLHASAYTRLWQKSLSQSFFLLFPFSLWLCRIARDENAKSGANECSQYLVFCQTWSTHNRGISWK